MTRQAKTPLIATRAAGAAEKGRPWRRGAAQRGSDPEPAKPAPSAKASNVRIIAGQGVNVRSGPGKSKDKLFALAGFYMANDERLSRAPGRLTGVVGVVPVAFDL